MFKIKRFITFTLLFLLGFETQGSRYTDEYCDGLADDLKNVTDLQLNTDPSFFGIEDSNHLSILELQKKYNFIAGELSLLRGIRQLKNQIHMDQTEYMNAFANKSDEHNQIFTKGARATYKNLQSALSLKTFANAIDKINGGKKEALSQKDFEKNLRKFCQNKNYKTHTFCQNQNNNNITNELHSFYTGYVHSDDKAYDKAIESLNNIGYDLPSLGAQASLLDKSIDYIDQNPDCFEGMKKSDQCLSVYDNLRKLQSQYKTNFDQKYSERGNLIAGKDMPNIVNTLNSDIEKFFITKDAKVEIETLYNMRNVFKHKINLNRLNDKYSSRDIKSQLRQLEDMDEIIEKGQSGSEGDINKAMSYLYDQLNVILDSKFNNKNQEDKIAACRPATRKVATSDNSGETQRKIFNNCIKKLQDKFGGSSKLDQEIDQLLKDGYIELQNTKDQILAISNTTKYKEFNKIKKLLLGIRYDQCKSQIKPYRIENCKLFGLDDVYLEDNTHFHNRLTKDVSKAVSFLLPHESTTGIDSWYNKSTTDLEKVCKQKVNGEKIDLIAKNVCFRAYSPSKKIDNPNSRSAPVVAQKKAREKFYKDHDAVIDPYTGGQRMVPKIKTGPIYANALNTFGTKLVQNMSYNGQLKQNLNYQEYYWLTPGAPGYNQRLWQEQYKQFVGNGTFPYAKDSNPAFVLPYYFGVPNTPNTSFNSNTFVNQSFSTVNPNLQYYNYNSIGGNGGFAI